MVDSVCGMLLEVVLFDVVVVVLLKVGEFFDDECCLFVCLCKEIIVVYLDLYECELIKLVKLFVVFMVVLCEWGVDELDVSLVVEIGIVVFWIVFV